MKIIIDRNNPLPLYIQLKEELSKGIVEGRWKVDSQIPTEQELMKLYGVGRATVREAISMLVNQGYLCKNQGVGTFVIRNKPSIGFEPLMSLSYTLKTKGLKGNNEVIEQYIFEPTLDMIAKFKWKTKKQCFYLKRLRYVEGVPAAIENSYFNEEFSNPKLKALYEGALTNIIINELKIKICKIDQTFTLALPSDDEIKLLNITDNNQVLHLERWIYAENCEEPFYYLRFTVPESIYYLPMEVF